MTHPLSPVNNTANVTLIETFQSADIIKLYKDQFGIDVHHFFKGETFSLFQCNQTGYRFYYPQGMDGDGAFYAGLQQKMGDGYYHDWKFENQLAYDNIKRNDKVLDIGCGTGKFLMRAKEKGAEVCGLELNEKAVGVCREKGLEVYNELISEHAVKKEGYYDMVCMFQVLEHIYDVKNFLDDSLKVLKKGGIIVIAVPNNEPYFKSYDKYATLNLPPHHMGLWNKKAFEKSASLFNLKMKDVQYDEKGAIKGEAYLRAKNMANVISPAGLQTSSELLKILLLGIITLPLSIIKKITKGINGSHIAVLFEKL
ncbi:MAG TPA: class I SAM-dependent methyltransferase [Ferruginibacter sp.]|nr:class I SAM-dependent methyltransferase [Ferruginibacter sp.]